MTNDSGIMEENASDFKKIQQQTLKEKLLNPKVIPRKPLDKLFVEIINFLDVPSNAKSNIDYIYFKISSLENADEFAKRWLVIDTALGLLQEVQLLSNEEKEKSANKDIITISLPDMKIFGELLNLIIIEGFYSLLPNSVGVPLERRRLKSFNESLKITKIRDPKSAEKLLQLLVDRFLEVFEKGGDVRGLLMRGSGYSDLLTGSISLMCNPSSSNKEQHLEQFKRIEALSPTFELFSLYTLLLQPYSQPWVKVFASKRLSLLTIERPDGVLSLIEFVVGMRDDEDINIEKIDHVSRILISKPQSISSIDYFSAIGKQLFEILGLINRPLLTSIGSHIIESIFERNQNIINDFVFKHIWDNFNPSNINSNGVILTNEKDLNNTFNVILSLSKRSSPEILNTLFEPLLLPLWSYLVYNKKTAREIGPITDIFISFFTITNNEEALDVLVNNLLISGGGDNWLFEVGPNGLIQIVVKATEIEPSNETFFNNLDTAVGLMISIMKDIGDDLLRKEFSTILKRWLKVSDVEIESLTADENPYLLLIDLKLLESIVENFKDRLSKSPDDMLIVVKNVLINNQENIAKAKAAKQQTSPSFERIVQHDEEQQGDSDDEDEADEEKELSESLKVVLELLSAILSETSLENLSKSSISTLEEILNCLTKLDSPSAESLHQRITRLLEGGLSAEKSEADLDKVTLARAITSLNDPLVPIRAHGLFLLRQLIERKSSAISLESVIDLHLIQLKDPEPYIYLNVIKGLDALIGYDKNETLPLLLSIYTDLKYTLDERLRIGEVLLRFITNANDTLTGSIASSITSATLNIIRVDPNVKQENTLRMSAMSLLGMCCKTNPVGIVKDLPDCFDCVLGILNLERSEDELVMRRSAIVLVHDLISGPGGLESVPKNYGKKCLTVLNYVAETDNDLLVRDQLKDVLYYIKELFKEKWTSTDTSFENLKI